MYQIKYTKDALKAIPKLKAAHLDTKAQALISLIQEDPYKVPPSYERLRGELQGAISRRINIKHRLVYQVFDNEQVIKIVSMWTHYEF